MASLNPVLFANAHVRHENPDMGEQLTPITQLFSMEVASALGRSEAQHLHQHQTDHLPPRLLILDLHQLFGQPASIEKH